MRHRDANTLSLQAELIFHTPETLGVLWTEEEVEKDGGRWRGEGGGGHRDQRRGCVSLALPCPGKNCTNADTDRAHSSSCRSYLTGKMGEVFLFYSICILCGPSTLVRTTEDADG